MTISELAQWRERNQLADAWYLEINEQGVGVAMPLADVREFTQEVWRKDRRVAVRVAHVSMSGNEAAWMILQPEPAGSAENLCPGCGADCEALLGLFPGKGISGGEWLGIVVFIVFAVVTGVTTGALYGWLLLLFCFLPLIGRFFREKIAIWRCPNCHLTRLRRK